MNRKQHISKWGFSDNSPYNKADKLEINTPSGYIDMSQTGIPLFANGQLLQPYSGQHYMGTTNVTEIPAVQRGGQLPMAQNGLEKIKQQFVSNIMPFDYSEYDHEGTSKDWWERVVDTSFHNEKETKRANLDDEFKKGNISSANLPRYQERIDLLNMFAGFDQVYNSVPLSEYRPSQGDNDDTIYYDSPYARNEIKNRFKEILEWEQTEGWDINDFARNFYDRDGEQSREPDKDKMVPCKEGEKGCVKTGDGWFFGLNPKYEKDNPQYKKGMYSKVLGNFKLDKGQDDHGHYISYYDDWNLNPTGVNVLDGAIDYLGGLTPPEIYGRIYYNPDNGQIIKGPGGKKRKGGELPKAQAGITEFEVDENNYIQTEKGYDKDALFNFAKNNYTKVNTASQKSDLVTKLNSPAFRERYRKNIFNISGENLSEEELTNRINQQSDFTEAGPDFHVTMPYITTSHGGYKNSSTPYINPFAGKDIDGNRVGLQGVLDFRRNQGLYQQKNTDGRDGTLYGNDFYDKVTNPDFPELAKYPYIPQLSFMRDAYTMGDNQIRSYDNEGNTIVHEYAHSYNTDDSALFNPEGEDYSALDVNKYDADGNKISEGSFIELPGEKYKGWLSNLFGEDYFDKDKNKYGTWAMHPWEISSIKSETEGQLKDNNIWDHTKGEFTEANLNNMIKYNSRLDIGGHGMDPLNRMGYSALERMNYKNKRNIRNQDDANWSIDNNPNDYILDNIINAEDNPSMDMDAFNIIFNNSQSNLKDKQKYSDYNSLLEDYKNGNKRKKKRATEIINTINKDVKYQINQGYNTENENYQIEYNKKKGEVLPKLKQYFNEIVMDDVDQPTRAKYGGSLPKAQDGWFDKVKDGVNSVFNPYGTLLNYGVNKVKENVANNWNASKGYVGEDSGFATVPNVLERIWNTGFKNESEIADKYFTGEGALEQNMFKMYLGQPQDGAFQFQKSQYVPTKGHKEGDEYWSIPEEYRNSIYGTNSFPQEINLGGWHPDDGDLMDYLEQQYSGVVEADMVVGDYTRGVGRDEDNNIYLSAYDKFDLNPFNTHQAGPRTQSKLEDMLSGFDDLSFGIGAPQSIYDRFGYTHVNYENYPEFYSEKDRGNVYRNDVLNNRLARKEMDLNWDHDTNTWRDSEYTPKYATDIIPRNKETGRRAHPTSNLVKQKQYGGSLPKAQFGINSIMSGNAYGTNVAGTTGVLGNAYKRSGFEEVVEKVDPYVTLDNTELAGGFVPYLGEVIDAKNTIKSMYEGNYGDAALHALGFAIPFIPGKAIVKGYKNLFGNADEVVDAVNTTTKKVVKGGNYVTPKWSQGVTHYGKIGPEGVEGALTGMKNQGKHLDEIGFDVSTLNGNNMVFHGNKHGRNIVEVALPDGKTQLFYKSSGLAGKSGSGVAGTTEGLWQPFGGHASTSINGNQVDNWFIKDGGYSDFYGSQTFRDISGNLDKIATDMNWDMSGQILKSKQKYGGSIPIAQEGEETGINFSDLEKGIKWSESLNGTLMKNSETSASGYYGDLFDNLDYDGTRDEFIADTDYQEEYFRKRAHGEVENIPGLINNGTELLEEYKDVEHGLSGLEISALSNMLGRQGTREYLGNVIRDGQTLAEVFPHLYGEDVAQTNKTPQEYIDKFNEGLLKKKMGGSVMTKVKRLNQQLALYNKGGNISQFAKRELESLNMIKPQMQNGGQTPIVHNSYIIKKGDNLSRIASNADISLSELLTYNPSYMSDPSSIQPGQVLKLSKDAILDNNKARLKTTIKRGDTLSGIASKFGVSYEDIAKINNISDPRKIQPGQVIILPDNSNTTDPVIQENIRKAESLYTPSITEVDVDTNPNVNVPWAKRIPPHKSESGQWETKGKRNIKTEINKMDQADRIIQGMNDIEGDNSKVIDYEIKGGDNLSLIAQKNGVTTKQLMTDNNILDANNIQVGKKIKIKKSTGKPYIVVDEKQGRMHLYYPGQDKPSESFPILTGANEGDAQTVTKIGVFKDGKTLNRDELNQAMRDNLPEGTDWTVDNLLEFGEGYTTETDWDAGNKQTGAGVYTIGIVNEDSGYYDDSGKGRKSPSFVLNNSNDDEVPMVIHTSPSAGDRVTNLNDSDGSNNRVTNGCINGKCTDLLSLYNNPDVGEGTQVFVLPEDANNNFVYENGQMNFYASSDNQTDYKEYIDENGEVQKGHGIANKTTTNYKPINITFDKNYYQTNSERYDGTAAGEEEEFVNNTQPFLNSIADNKKLMMDKLGMDGDMYNDLAMIAFGIYGYESGMGDEGSGAENFLKAGLKFTGLKDTSPDVQSKYDTYGVDGPGNSVGWTQIRWGQLNDSEKEALSKIDITSNDQLMDPANAAKATTAILYKRYQNQISRKDKNSEDFDIFTELPKKWLPTNLNEDKKTEYVNIVNGYTDYINLSETDIDDVDNNLIVKGEYSDDNVASNERYKNKGWQENVEDFLNMPEAIEQSYNSSTYVKPIVDTVSLAVDDASNAVSEWWDEVDLNPFWKRGGEFSVGNQVQFYSDYINGRYKGTKQENKSKKMYDKLNRMYYNDSKKSNKHQLDIMNHILRSNR